MGLDTREEKEEQREYRCKLEEWTVQDSYSYTRLLTALSVLLI